MNKIKCKHGHYNKKRETFRVKCKYCDCFLEYTKFVNDLIEYKCLGCNKTYQQKFDENVKKQFLIQANFLTMITIIKFHFCERCLLL